MRVLAISGSLRNGSHSRQLLRAARELAGRDFELEIYDGLEGVPAFNQDREADAPAPVAELRELIAGADALLIATPEYNASIPGALKNALDWASRPHGLGALVGKPTAVVSSSPSPFGGTWAGEHLRRSLAIAGALVTERELAVGKVDQKLADGHLVDPEARDDLADLLEELVELASTAPQREEQPLAA